MYNCNECDRVFDTKQALGGHRSGTHKILRYSVTRKKRETKYCRQCTTLITSRSPKFCSQSCQQAWRRDNILNTEIQNGNVVHPKKFVVEIQGRRCSECDLDEWMGQPIPLDLDHIDGNNKNNKIENLRLLCPNCHRLTPTWGNSKFQRKNKQRFINSPVECFLDMEEVAGSIPA